MDQRKINLMLARAIRAITKRIPAGTITVEEGQRLHEFLRDAEREDEDKDAIEFLELKGYTVLKDGKAK